MSLRARFHSDTDSPAASALRMGCIALCGTILVYFGAYAFDGYLNTPREVPGRWIDGDFHSDPFWIFWGGHYDLFLYVSDTAVATQDHHELTFGHHWTSRCGQPFPTGFTWTVFRRGKRIDEQRYTDERPWCEDISTARAIQTNLGSFRAVPGFGYSVRVASVAPDHSERPPPLRIATALHPGQGWSFVIPAGLLCALLAVIAAGGIAFGLAAWVWERIANR